MSSGLRPKFRRVRPHVVTIFLHTLNIAARRDDRIGMLGGKGAATRRTAGLDEGWAALGRGHGVERAAALEKLAVEIDRVDLAPIGVDAAIAVHDHRARFPG